MTTNGADNNRKYRIRLVSLIAISLLILIPLLVLAKYDRPSADDFSYSHLTHQSIINNDGIVKTLISAIKTDINFYFSWQGLYTSAFLLSLQPAILGEQFYVLTPYIIIILSFVSFLLGINILNKNFLHYSFFFSLVSSLFTIAFIYCWLPTVSQGLYWYNSAMNYMPWVFTNFLNICLCIESIQSVNRKKHLIVLTVIISFATSGANHVTAFANILFLICVSVYFVIFKKRYITLLPLFSAIIGFIIMFIAPGTAIRMSRFTQATISNTIIQSFLHTLYFLKENCNLIWFLSLIIITPVAIRFASNKHITKNTLIMSLLLSFGIICAMFCVPYYALGFFGPVRVQNVIWSTFILLSWGNYFLFINYLYFNFQTIQSILTNYLYSITSVIFTILFSTLIIILPQNGKDSSTIQALKELQNGEAKAYCEEMDERFNKINNSLSQNIEVEPIKVKSELLFIDDITYEDSDWRNIAMNQYYNKHIILKH